MPQLRERTICPISLARARAAGLGEVAARIVAGRVRECPEDLGPLVDPGLRSLPDPRQLPDALVAVTRLVAAIESGERIGLVTDYDVDGITAHTLLRAALIDHFGVARERVSGFIGHRMRDGYGLSDNVAEQILAHPQPPAVVITADCGSSDGPRIERLAAAGIDVIVTDHHTLPVAGPPAAALAVVNPARRESAFGDPAIAGCTVAWLLMSLLRSALVEAGALPDKAPKLGGLLDLVALGTVADAVSLFSPANRALVNAGLQVLNDKRRPCWQELAVDIDRRHKPFVVDDLGFQVGPRINARGRLDDPFAALHFLRAGDTATARRYLDVLSADNQERKQIEAQMLVQARRQVQESLRGSDQLVLVADDSFHAGVQGIVASRLLEQFGRVTGVLSPAAEPGFYSGSLRSIDGVDIAAALRAVDASRPGLLSRFGGHPKAAGITLERALLEPFRAALAAAVREQLGDVATAPTLWVDGALEASQIAWETVREIDTLAPYGRGFEAPLFRGRFAVASLRPVGADPVHIALEVRHPAGKVRGIWFSALERAGDPLPVEVGQQIDCAFRLEADSYRGGQAVQLVVAHAEAC